MRVIRCGYDADELLKQSEPYKDGSFEENLDFLGFLSALAMLGQAAEETEKPQSLQATPRQMTCKCAEAPKSNRIKIKKVYFQEPYTIIVWSDGSKSITKCSENDVYDKRTGFIICLAKRVIGKKRLYHLLDKYCGKLDRADTDIAEA